ncbi:MAG: hypothetical protein PHW31_03790 [Candidatus Pacebacteria bacterium]|nr:hypothetical protein [Candidatus Paceibacterota bacterium]
MANIIALAIFIVSFIGIVFLIFGKLKDLADLPEQTVNSQAGQRQLKQNILQKTALIQQAVLHNKKVEAVMAKAGGKFKAVFANRVTTQEEMEKVEKIHQEGDYWHKVEQHKLPSKKMVSKQPKSEIIQVSAVEVIETSKIEPQVKKPRTRKKKDEQITLPS